MNGRSENAIKNKYFKLIKNQSKQSKEKSLGFYIIE